MLCKRIANSLHGFQILLSQIMLAMPVMIFIPIWLQGKGRKRAFSPAKAGGERDARGEEPRGVGRGRGRGRGKAPAKRARHTPPPAEDYGEAEAMGGKRAERWKRNAQRITEESDEIEDKGREGVGRGRGRGGGRGAARQQRHDTAARMGKDPAPTGSARGGRLTSLAAHTPERDDKAADTRKRYAPASFPCTLFHIGRQ